MNALLYTTVFFWLAGPAAKQDAGNWPQFRGSGACTGVALAQLTPPFKQKWLAPIGIVNSSPSVVGNTVYVGSYDNHLYAVAADTGKVRWKTPLGKPVYASPAVANEHVYVCCVGEQGETAKARQQRCRIVCLQADSGKIIWDHPLIHADVKYDLGNWAGGWASPVLGARHLYVGSDDRFLYCLDRATGKQVWSFLTDGRPHSSPSLVGDTLFSGCHDGHVYALDASSGKLRWRFKTGSLVNSTVAYHDGHVYFGSYDKHVYALKASDGALVWKTETDPKLISHIVASPSVTEDAVFIGTWPGTMYALERQTGQVRWYTPLGARIQASSTVAGGVVYTLASSRLAGLDVKTGKVAWEASVGNGFGTSTPTVVSSGLYVGSRAGLHCFVTDDKK